MFYKTWVIYLKTFLFKNFVLSKDTLGAFPNCRIEAVGGDTDGGGQPWLVSPQATGNLKCTQNIFCRFVHSNKTYNKLKNLRH